MESSESDLDSDASFCIDLDICEEKESSGRDSPICVWNEPEVNTGPVLSVKCLHDDSVNEENESSRNGTEPKLEFVDIDDVPVLSINSEEEDNEDFSHKAAGGREEHPHLVPLIQNGSSSKLAPLLAAQHHSSIPARNNWDGAHNFKIKVNCDGTLKKTESPIFSETQNKLYITKDQPFKVLVSAENVPIGSMIKVTADFSLVEHSYEIVQRCPTHAQQDYIKGVAAYEHFVQCFSDAAIYERNKENGKLSVSVRYEKPQEGETYSTYLFKLTCFSSCSGGLNRRPFMLIFTLEKGNIPLGRQTIEAKVCACPQRDFRMDTERKSRKASKTSSNDSSQSNSEKTPTKYTISVKDRELYLFLKQMKVLYETGTQLMQDT